MAGVKKAKAPSRPEPSARRQSSIAKARGEYEARPLRCVPNAYLKDGALMVESPHTDDEGFAMELANTFGTASQDFANQMLLDIVNAVGTDRTALGAAIALIGAVEPANELEGMLAVQMAAVHASAMRELAETRKPGSLAMAQHRANTSTKMLRTFATQLEALGKLRRGGEQVVRHVHVYEGGQAVVAEQVHLNGGRNVGNVGGQPHALSAALPGADPFGHGVPVASNAERPVPDARREVAGCAEGQQA